jgi:PAS domain S-box-containing protein
MNNPKTMLSNQSTDEIIENYENILSVVPCHIYWKDLEGRYLGCNLLQAKTLGFSSPQEIVGKTDYELPWYNQAAALRATDMEVATTQKDFTVEEMVVLSDNQKSFFLSKKSPMRTKDGVVKGIIGISFDITDRKNTEEELIKAKITAEKEQEMRKTVMVLVGDIVHDLYTPLAIIGNGAGILESISSGLNEVIEEANNLKSKKLNSINRKKLNYVINEMSAAQKDSVKMINDFIKTTLRELSVAQKYQDEPISREELTKCSSRRILENVLDSYPRRDNIKINECFPYDFFLMGNSILMMKVLFNLIRNAEEQIIANGKGEITITSEETEDKNLLIVKDTAGGAPPEVVENFFKEFFTTKKNGSGIGLASCKKIMHDLGGDLTCRSVFGESMEFILSFPKVDSVE